ncbi:MAG: ABC transporter substrate-binding protein [Pseudoclavibacter sp.]
MHATRPRPWLRLTAAAAVLTGLVGLTACSADASGAASGDADYGTMQVPLSWLHTAEFAGMYMAIDNGYYEEAGFESVELIPGGPSATPSTVQVASGANLVGLSNPLLVGSAIDEEGEDAPLKIIGSVFQQIPYTVITKSENPANAPDDLIGMSVGVPPANEPVFNAFLEANGLVGQVELVSIQSDTQPFLQDEIDAFFGFATNELISIEMAGYDVQSMMFVDHGLALAGGSIVASESAIEEHREELKAFLAASIRGWQDALADDEAAATSTVETHAADQNLDYDHQLTTAQVQSGLIANDWTDENGLFTMSDESVQNTLDGIAAVGYDVPDDLFDLSLLDEVYAENSDLIAPTS